jgi:hypothetical protein
LNVGAEVPCPSSKTAGPPICDHEYESESLSGSLLPPALRETDDVSSTV